MCLESGFRHGKRSAAWNCLDLFMVASTAGLLYGLAWFHLRQTSISRHVDRIVVDSAVQTGHD